MNIFIFAERKILLNAEKKNIKEFLNGEKWIR